MRYTYSHCRDQSSALRVLTIILGGETNTYWFGGDSSYVVSASADKWRSVRFPALHNWNSRFSRRTKERQFPGRRANFVAHCLDCDLHLKFGSGCSVLPADTRKGDHSFQRRRPGRGSRPPYLKSSSIDRDSHAGRGAGNLRRESNCVVQSFDVVPVDVQARQEPPRTAAIFFLERRAPDEMLLPEIHQPAQPDFVGRVFLRFDQRFLAAEVVHFDQDQTRFDSRDIECQHPRRVQIELPALLDQNVPHPGRVIPWHPDLVA